jgi:hypothetical protein
VDVLVGAIAHYMVTVKEQLHAKGLENVMVLENAKELAHVMVRGFVTTALLLAMEQLNTIKKVMQFATASFFVMNLVHVRALVHVKVLGNVKGQLPVMVMVIVKV